jgi:surfactin family lipopeptide synthetase A
MKETIIRCFETTVAAHPNSDAVVDGLRVLTYAELNSKANYLANVLRTFDTGMQSKNIKSVHLLFDHGSDMIIAMLAVLKCGYCYVPLAPDFPQARTKDILTDSEPSVILTNNRNLDKCLKLKAALEGKIVIVNINNVEGYHVSDKNLEINIAPDQLAYVLYTSGSTGMPKGVMQNQQNILHFVRSYSSNLKISKDDKLTGLSSYTFDASVMSIYGALINGASLHLYNLKEHCLTDLKDWLQENQITIYHSTPTIYRYFIETLSGFDCLDSIRLVVLGGEVMLKSDVELYKKYFSDKAFLINGLGPSESTVTLQYFIDKKITISSATVPVGYPVAETEVFILNKAGEVIHNEEVGELIICSDHLALGYLNLPEKSNQVFLSNLSFTERRAYKTGDLCRRLENGALEFIGRSDFQVKIRGHRVELNEIEYALDKIQEIKKSVVTTYIKEGELIIIAHYTLKESMNLNDSQLKQKSRELMPEYMIPSHFVYQREFPCTLTGKIDRKKLDRKNEILFDPCFI